MQLERGRHHWIGRLKGITAAALVAGAALVFTGCSGSPEDAEQRIVQAFSETVHESLNRDKQFIFNKIHPVGHASWAEVNEAAVSRWRMGERTGRPRDVAAFDYVFTLHWDSPMVQNGFTRVFCRYDFTVGRTVEMRVLESNGLTNEDASNLVDLLGMFMLGQ